MPKYLCPCGNIHNGPGIHCPDCKPRKPQNTTTKSREQRGLGSKHRASAKRTVETNRQKNGGIGVCENCGRQETSHNPLTAQHLVPRALGGQDSPLAAWCRQCNSRDGAATAAILRKNKKRT